MQKAERLLESLRAGKREAALGGCLAIAAPGTLNFYREPGRLKVAPACLPASGHLHLGWQVCAQFFNRVKRRYFGGPARGPRMGALSQGTS